jgi:hypothetical protein
MTLTTESALRKDKRTAERGKMDTLQHRHFAFIASVIAKMPDFEFGADIKQSTALQFADACAANNPRFDRRRFFAACGLSS